MCVNIDEARSVPVYADPGRLGTAGSLPAREAAKLHDDDDVARGHGATAADITSRPTSG